MIQLLHVLAGQWVVTGANFRDINLGFFTYTLSTTLPFYVRSIKKKDGGTNSRNFFHYTFISVATIAGTSCCIRCEKVKKGLPEVGESH